MTDKHSKLSYDENTSPPESGNRLHLWLIIAALAVFIFLLFYSQKIHGMM